jgi:hypothetical protein
MKAVCDGPDGVQVDGTDVTEVLCENEIGPQAGEEVGVKGVERGPACQLFSDSVVDVAWRRGWEGALRGEDGDGVEARGKVAFMGSARERGAAADKAQEFGGTREKAGDPHRL